MAGKFLPNGRPPEQWIESPTVYQLNFLTLAAGVSTSQSIQIQADSDFKLIKTTMLSAITLTSMEVATEDIPFVSCQITDTGSGRNLFNANVPLPNIFGQGRLPFIWPIPYVFPARSSMTVNVTSFDTTSTFNIYLSFIGTKLFPL